MTPLVRNGVILAGVLVLGGAATAIIVTSQTTKQAPEAIAPAVAPPSSAQASSPPEAAPLPQAAPGAATSPAQPVAAPATPVLAFDPLVQRFSLLRDSAAYVAASTAAPQMYPLKSGTPLVSAAKSRDGAWIIATTADGQAAYLPAADLGPYDPSRAPAPDVPAHLSGPATVVDTGTLVVAGHTIALDGVVGQTGEYINELQGMINGQGASVQCDAQGQGYVCTLPSGIDIGRAGLFNGGADLAPDASADYQQQAAAAKAARKGIWR